MADSRLRLAALAAQIWLAGIAAAANGLIEWLIPQPPPPSHLTIGSHLFQDTPPLPGCSGGVRFHSEYEDYYREGGMETRGASFARTFAAESFLRWQRGVLKRITLAGANQYRRIWSGNADPPWEIINTNSQNDATATIELQYCSLFGAVGVRSYSLPKNRTTPLAGINIAFPRWLDAAAQWEQLYLSERLDGSRGNDRASILFSGDGEQTSARLITSEKCGFAIDASYSRSIWMRRNRDTPDAELTPWGDEQHYRINVSHLSKLFRIAAFAHGNWLDWQMYGMKYGLPFAKVTYCEYKRECYGIEWSSFDRHTGNNTLNLSLERGWSSFYGRGHVEFWPFTSGLIDLLGLRRYFIGSASNNYWLATFSNPYQITPHWRLRSFLTLIDTHQSGEFEHWKPVFLVFGKTDVRTSGFAVERLIAGAVTIRSDWQGGDWALSYQFSQFFPIRNWKIDPSKPYEGAKPSSDFSVAGRFPYGGGIHRITFSKYYQLLSK